MQFEEGLNLKGVPGWLWTRSRRQNKGSGLFWIAEETSGSEVPRARLAEPRRLSRSLREGVIVVSIRCAWARISAPPPATASLQKAGNKRKQPTHNWFLFHQDGTDPVGKVAVLCIHEREFS